MKTKRSFLKHWPVLLLVLLLICAELSIWDIFGTPPRLWKFVLCFATLVITLIISLILEPPRSQEEHAQEGKSTKVVFFVVLGIGVLMTVQCLIMPMLLIGK